VKTVSAGSSAPRLRLDQDGIAALYVLSDGECRLQLKPPLVGYPLP
jgi:hypothetical protein